MDVHSVTYRFEMTIAQQMGDEQQKAIQDQKDLDAEQKAERDQG